MKAALGLSEATADQKEQIDRLEERLDALEEKIDTILEAVSKPKPAPRKRTTKK